MAEEKVQHAIEGKQIVKQIVVPGKIVNLVVKVKECRIFRVKKKKSKTTEK